MRNAFDFVGALPPAAEIFASEMRSANSVALSVRRGDYLNAANAKILRGTNEKYYEDAVAHVAERVPSPHFFVFSDDIEWCREHIRPPFMTTYVPADLPAHVVMRLASLCKHQIIRANSGFSHRRAALGSTRNRREDRRRSAEVVYGWP